MRNVVTAFSGDHNPLLFISSAGPEENRIVDLSHESLIRKWRLLSTWAREEAESAEWFSDLLRDTRRMAEAEAGYWTEPALSRALACKARDGWNEAWAQQYGCDGPSGFAAVESFLEGSRRKEFARKRNRFLAYAGAVLLLITGLFAVEQTRHAHLAEAEVQRLNDQLGNLEKERDNAKTEVEKRKYQSQIDAIQSKIAMSGGMEQEIQDLKTKLADATKQPKAVAPDPQVATLQQQVKELTAKAQAAETLRTQYDVLSARLREIDQERSRLAIQAQAQTQAPQRTPLVTQAGQQAPPPPVMSDPAPAKPPVATPARRRSGAGAADAGFRAAPERYGRPGWRYRPHTAGEAHGHLSADSRPLCIHGQAGPR